MASEIRKFEKTLEKEKEAEKRVWQGKLKEGDKAHKKEMQKLRILEEKLERQAPAQRARGPTTDAARTTGSRGAYTTKGAHTVMGVHSVKGPHMVGSKGVPYAFGLSRGPLVAVGNVSRWCYDRELSEWRPGEHQLCHVLNSLGVACPSHHTFLPLACFR